MQSRWRYTKKMQLTIDRLTPTCMLAIAEPEAPFSNGDELVPLSMWLAEIAHRSYLSRYRACDGSALRRSSAWPCWSLRPRSNKKIWYQSAAQPLASTVTYRQRRRIEQKNRDGWASFHVPDAWRGGSPGAAQSEMLSGRDFVR